MSKCSSRQSHSDYCSVGSYSSDEESTSVDTIPRSVLPAGICSNCQKIFEQPVTLQCGHSICLNCCISLLSSAAKLSNSISSLSISNRPRRPRMGINSLVTLPRSEATETSPAVVYRSPKCLVCGAGPSESAPIPNLELENILRSIRGNRKDPEVSRRKCEDSLFHECKIAVVGARGVGKTCLARVQHSNEVTFPDNSIDGDESDCYIIDIVDEMNLTYCYSNSHGIILMYSVSDRHSFYEAAEIFKKLETNLEHHQPIVLVGSKKDKERRREVTSFEGQQLARSIGCPFFEVSAKMNDCVHESFVELVSMIKKRNNDFKNLLQQTVV